MKWSILFLILFISILINSCLFFNPFFPNSFSKNNTIELAQETPIVTCKLTASPSFIPTFTPSTDLTAAPTATPTDCIIITPTNLKTATPIPTLTITPTVVSTSTPTAEVYKYRRLLTINSAKIDSSSNLEFFPLLIQITDDYLKNTLYNGKIENINGYDIFFTAQDGITPLSYQIENYNPVNGNLTVWVSIPSLSYSVDTQIYMYYGKNVIVSLENITAVWGIYQGVWHLNNDFNDSTVNCYNGTNAGTTSITGKIGYGRNFSGDNYIDMANVINQNYGNLTISLWMKKDSSGIQAIVAKSKGSNPKSNYGYLITLTNDNKICYYTATTSRSWGSIGTFALSSSIAITDSNWHQIVCVINRMGNNYCKIFIDGINRTGTYLGNITTVGNITNNYALRIGAESDGDFKLGGIIDEIVITNTILNDSWIITSYNNQSNPATFYTVGTEELLN